MTGSPVVKADHGRIETRTATLSAEMDCLQKLSGQIGRHTEVGNLHTTR